MQVTPEEAARRIENAAATVEGLLMYITEMAAAIEHEADVTDIQRCVAQVMPAAGMIRTLAPKISAVVKYSEAPAVVVV